jgi:tellurite resistance-related uncharacterized protein
MHSSMPIITSCILIYHDKHNTWGDVWQDIGLMEGDVMRTLLLEMRDRTGVAVHMDT